MLGRMHDRRQFLVSAGALLAALGCATQREKNERTSGPSTGAPSEEPATARATRSSATKSILVLGGTRFVGRAFVDAALADGHTVTLHNRGRTNADLFRGVERIVGDRNGTLAELRGRKWDVVVDTWTDYPRHVRSACEVLRDAASHYVFVSSLNAVRDISVPGLDETAKPVPPSSEDAPRPTDSDESIQLGFGNRKRCCERIVEEVFGDRWTVVRPGLIVGPDDRSDRFTYWPVRVARGGEVLAPGKPSDPVQFVDVRDLGRFLSRTARESTFGMFHVVGPKDPIGIGDVLDACARVTKSDARFTWADAEFLMEQGVRPWTDMPLWIPSFDAEEVYWRLDISRALAAGIEFRPLEDTVRDTLAWWRDTEGSRALRNRMSAERESAVLAAWHARAIK
jgi:2'-hydroxyisoflavone reductase